MKALILYGHQACGKTYFGKLLAQKLECLFVDTDLEIERVYLERFCEALSCRQIAKKWGELFFRELEAEVILSLDGDVLQQVVIAVGGGAVFHEASYLKLKALGILIYLELEKEKIQQRLFRKGVGIPSYLDPAQPEASFERIYEERKKVYEKLSPHRVVLAGKSDAQVLEDTYENYNTYFSSL